MYPSSKKNPISVVKDLIFRRAFIRRRLNYYGSDPIALEEKNKS